MSSGQHKPGRRRPSGNRSRNWWRRLVAAMVGVAVVVVVMTNGCQPPPASGPRQSTAQPDAAGNDTSPSTPSPASPRNALDAPSDNIQPTAGDAAVPGSLSASQRSTEEIERGPILLHDVTPQTGITFQHTDGSTGRRYIVETVSSGLATFDYDLDGLMDIYFVNGAAIPGVGSPQPPRNQLYRNIGDWRFVEVTGTAGVGDTRHGLGATIGDYNNDGYPDIYVSNIGENVLYRNNGDGTFDDVSQRTGTAVSDNIRVGAGVCFLDLEGDGDLDLFVANYLQFSPDKSSTNLWRGQQIYAGPERFPPYPCVLLRNNGDETFTDVSKEAGVAQYPGYGMGITCGDFDQDGATDVFVGNDGGPGNFLFFNDGKGVFEEAGMLTGVAYSGAGLAHGSMGADCGDFDNDGLLDLFVTSYQRQLATLFRNVDHRRFEDVTQQTGAGIASFNQVTWGCGLVDLDNDGLRDIFYACGHLIDNIDDLDDSTSYLAQPVVMRNTSGGRFVNVTASAGAGVQKKSVGRGAAFEDFDNDGDLDVAINNSRQTPTVLRNDSLGDPHWLEIRLVGRRSNRDGVGAQVRVTASDHQQIDEVHSGRAFQSHFGTRLHFGLGSTDVVDQIEIRWIGGGIEIWEDVPANTSIVLVQESGKAVPAQSPSAR